jgi:transcriptional regulator with XRE-family HTH domain
MPSLSKMIQELIQNSGMTEESIAMRCSVSQPTVHRIKNGAASSYCTGKKIEAIYAELSKATSQNRV